VLAALRARRSSGAGHRSRNGVVVHGGVYADPGLEAREVWSRDETGRSPLPGVPLPPHRPGDPAPLAVDPPSSSGVRREDLADLAADAADRAWALCLGEGDGGLTLEEDLDLVRRAARLLRSPSRRGAFGEMAVRAGVRASDLVRDAGAWRLGGTDAIEVIGEPTSPPAEALEEGRAVMTALGEVRAWRNRLTVAGAGVQLRLSRAGAWYRFEKAGGGWELVAGPEADPAQALSVRA
jgi:hypothetical protein